MSTLALTLCKLLALACLSLALTVGAYAAFSSKDSRLRRLHFRYVASLERRMRILFLDTRGQHVLLAQLGGCLLSLALAGLTSNPHWLLLVPALALAPKLVLERMRKKRVQAIEAKLDTFVVALSNALRASPSPGRALGMVQAAAPAPLDRELELVLREMRVGSTLEQALGNMSARVGSFQLDAALSGLLIGRQTGGNIPAILDAAAETLREMARLQGVLRAKTAEARAQVNVLAFLPALLVFAFDAVSPGYFRPLTDSASGLIVSAIALAMWVVSVLMMRQIMEVEL